MKDLLIIGAGPAGITAAIYGVRYGLTVSVFEGLSYGGQVATTAQVENYPAIEKIDGFNFSTKLYEQAKGMDVEFISENVTSVNFDGDEKTIVTDKNTYTGKTVIIATGAKRRKLNCVGEDDFTGRGVSYCATCDGAFFKNKDVAIVGGGNTALEDALFLANICNNVYLIHRRDTFKGNKVLADTVIKNEKIKILYNSTVESIEGDKVVTSVRILREGKPITKDVSGVFIAIGTEPENELYANYVELDEVGYIIADETCTTNTKGIFVAGDCRTKPLRQIVTATGDGAVAAFMAMNYITGQKS